MTGPDVNTAIRVKWRRRVESIGRQNFGTQEMAELGFPVSPNPQPPERDPAAVDTYTRVLDQLSSIKREMKADDGRPGEIAVVAGLIKTVRERRSGLLREERQHKQALKAAQPELMRGASKGVLHKNTASRKVSRLAARVKAIKA